MLPGLIIVALYVAIAAEMLKLRQKQKIFKPVTTDFISLSSFKFHRQVNRNANELMLYRPCHLNNHPYHHAKLLKF
jgi:hypothetical protein